MPRKSQVHKPVEKSEQKLAAEISQELYPELSDAEIEAELGIPPMTADELEQIELDAQAIRDEDDASG